MKIRVTAIPELKMGGILSDYPYAGTNNDTNPFGNISSDTTSDIENVNASAKPVEREKANIEAEKGELLLKFDFGGLFNIHGKRHSEGGTPLKADEGDFIFSRDKDLAITKKEKELFNFKEGGKYKKNDNTPAKVLAKEVNPKHYNQLLNILKDPKSDPIAKKTAELMLGKYTDKIGQVAFLQEAKKGFPDGLPDFTAGTAPVQSDEFEDVEAQEEQFEPGGRVRRKDKLRPNFQPPYVNAFTGPQAEVNAWGESLEPFGFTGKKGDVNAIQQWINTNAPDAAPYVYEQGMFGLNNKQYNPQRSDFSDQYVRDQFNDGLYAEDAFTFANRGFEDESQYNNFLQTSVPVGDLSTGQTYYDADRRNEFNKPVFEIPQYNGPFPTLPLAPGTLPVAGVNPQMTPRAIPASNTAVPGTSPSRRQRTAPVEEGLPWNAQEKLTTALPFLTAFMRKDQFPMLQQIHTPDIRLDRVSNAQELSDIRQQSALTQSELFSNMGARTAYQNSAQLRAQAINNIGRSNAQNNNINTQISNQEDMTNYQSMVNDRNFNVDAVQKNYDQTNLVLGRRQEEMSNAFAESINTGVKVQDKLDALGQSMTQSQMKTLDKNGQPRFVLDPRTRKPVLNPNWQGSIVDNPFIGAASNKTGYEAQIMKALVEGLNSGDARARAQSATVLQKILAGK